MSEPKQVIVVRADLNMRRGKEAAQVAHASMAWLAEYVVQLELGNSPSLKKPEKEWLLGPFAKIVVSVNSEAELLEIAEKAVALGVQCKTITDAGRTEFHGVPTLTCLALGPDYPEAIDLITGSLKLR